jgi:hypothetical protein
MVCAAFSGAIQSDALFPCSLKVSSLMSAVLGLPLILLNACSSKFHGNWHCAQGNGTQAPLQPTVKGPAPAVAMIASRCHL